MINPTKIHLISKPIDTDHAYLNKYTFMSYTYNYPHMKLLTIGDLVSNSIKPKIDLPEYVMDFIGERGEVLVVSNIVNKTVPYIQFRDLKSKAFSVYGSQTKLFYGQGFLPPNFKYGTPILLVEGSMDFCVGYGFYKNTLATMTAGLTTMQVEILKLLTDKVILAYDNDEAGRKATNRDSKKLKQLGFKIRYLNHYNDLKDLGDVAEILYQQDTLKFDIVSRYYTNSINNLLRSFGEI